MLHHTLKLLLFVIVMQYSVMLPAQNAEPFRIERNTVTNGYIYVITQRSEKYKFDSARYSVFIPKGIGFIEGILVHQHGCTMEGRGMATAYDLQYQAFAKKWNLVVIGPDLYDAKNNCHSWKDAESGTADALLKTIQNIASLSSRKEIVEAPWLLWGHSGGGYWAQSMMKQYPQRIMAVVSYSPGLNASFDYPKAATAIPVMIRHAGPAGDACCWQAALNTFTELRSKGAYAAITLTPFQNHNFSYIRYLTIPFFESVLTQRRPAKGKTGYQHMREMNDKKSWLGDTASLNIFKSADYRGDKLSAAWLPDSLMAIKWREYSLTGTIVDRTPPPAPFDVTMQRRHNVTVSVNWKADADIESGISHFNLYKNNQLVGRFPSTGSYQQFDTNGDDAYPLDVPPMKTDVMLLWSDSSKISVSAVNHFGLESSRATVQ